MLQANLNPTEMRETYLELLARAHEADRQPVCFTIGPDFEAIMINHLSGWNPEVAKALAEKGIEVVNIEGLPIRRMPSNGIALHTAEISTDLDHTPS